MLRCSFSCDDVLEVSEEGELIVNGESIRQEWRINCSWQCWYYFRWPSCHPEVAMSMESIFGKDVDILPWNHGMTDGRNAGLYNLWTQRTGVHPTRSILFSFGQRYYNDIHNDYVNAV